MKKPVKKKPPVKRTRDDVLGAIEDASRGSLTALTTAKWPNVRPPAFRVSSTPFCPMIFSGDVGETEAAYPSDFYFKHGTTEHELIQKALGFSVARHLMYGHWKCACRSEDAPPDHEWCTMPTTDCITCHATDWRYSEVQVEYKGLTGHVDMILRIPDPLHTSASKLLKGGVGFRFIVQDFKTSNLPEKDKKKKGWEERYQKELDKKYPVPANVHQISSYTALMRKKYRLNVCGWSLGYLDRSAPVRRIGDFHLVSHAWSKADDVKWMGRIERACRAAPTAIKVQHQLFQAPGKRKPVSLADVKLMVKERPCRSEAEYEDGMAASFYYDDPCPFRKNCCSPKASDDKLASFFVKKLTEAALSV